jgi:hypothetical protein
MWTCACSCSFASMFLGCVQAAVFMSVYECVNGFDSDLQPHCVSQSRSVCISPSHAYSCMHVTLHKSMRKYNAPRQPPTSV